ncbi:MAG: hypothetical protein DLM63_13065 [Solirubrobacterales bacterium]|nr:MAG: hypothetical protein DLM63_13065 [Solirubrobacterales bacterium]
MPAFGVASALLIFAGVAKWRSPESARYALALVGRRVPRSAVRALGAAETGLGAVALARPGTITASAVALAYGAFLVFIVTLLRSADRPASCGCFGDVESGAGAVHAALNGVGMSVAVLAAIAPPPGLGWILTRVPLIAAPLAIGIATAAFAAYLAFTAFPLAWRSYSSDAPT